MNSIILLSFDLEEFDIPEEYGEKIEDTVKMEISYKGLKEILQVLARLNIKATFFVTARFAIYYKPLIQEISQKHEIASHGFEHCNFRLEDLKKSRQTLEEITSQKVLGFRMPRLQKVDDTEIAKAGYKYNSSMNPTYIPGRYNNFFKPRTAYYSNNLVNIPVSVTPLIKFPLFWLSFKNFPLPLIKLASQLTLKNDHYISLYFHPWEFTDITHFHLPNYITKYSGKKMVERLEKYLIWLQTQGEFVYFSEFYETIRR
ncbi:polysaccharide deacetylase [Brasilonema octagenarum UFV-E1]|uniref:Polysaccharide deacetylase n=2 Tax=Brasilonema TaxID=383614 RepID=A0A856MBL9_9CYAN|nr:MULTISPECIES: polysaccharide deacetylase family protein [Brasilonema]NMF63616.1 polysaccharide deacetylase [Brasilonema octagenarum UFV-OR1]QDL08098.1 polysaccharide deacetylase [Brasilonema sennae CENA114]QDL14458.1 polysaccharide deacetylase [Brasilonema octagenarum UFV-E1]